MEVRVIDVWLEKIRRGWKIEDAPNEAIRKELKKRLGKNNKGGKQNDHYARNYDRKSKSIS